MNKLETWQCALIKESEGWIGVPYKYGGNDKQGVDCSGLVLRLYLDALQIKLPRTCITQSDFCHPVELKDISCGDLVFYATGNDSSRISHVGMMLDKDNFIHASSTKGVVITPLSNPWFKRKFIKAGRVGIINYDKR